MPSAAWTQHPDQLDESRLSVSREEMRSRTEGCSGKKSRERKKGGAAPSRACGARERSFWSTEGTDYLDERLGRLSETFGCCFEVGPVTRRGARHGETSNEDLDVRSVTHELEFLGRRLNERGRHPRVEQNRDAGSPSVRVVGPGVRRGFRRRRSGRRGGELSRRSLLHFTDLGRNRGGRGFESSACGS